MHHQENLVKKVGTWFSVKSEDLSKTIYTCKTVEYRPWCRIRRIEIRASPPITPEKLFVEIQAGSGEIMLVSTDEDSASFVINGKHSLSKGESVKLERLSSSSSKTASSYTVDIVKNHLCYYGTFLEIEIGYESTASDGGWIVPKRTILFGGR